VRTALRNGIKLAGSLLVTYGISLAVRFLLPRTLGPDVFGQYNWADGLSAAVFALSGLGIDPYVRKEVAVRPEHASDFFGGVLLVRTVISAVLMAGMAVYLVQEGEGQRLLLLAVLMGVAQIFLALSNTLAAVLHARDAVDGLSIMNVVSKCVWGAATLAALFLNAPLWWFGLPLLLSEALKAAVLYRLARKHAGLVLRLDRSATRGILLAALPLFLSDLAIAASGRLDATILGHMTEKREVGYYGAAWGISSMAMLLSPIISWVLLPMLSRAAAESKEALYAIIRRALETTVAFSMPVTLAMTVGADVWIHLLYGPAYAPARLTLQVMAPTYVLTYVAMTAGLCLLVLNRSWTVTRISLVGLALNPPLNIALIRYSASWGGGAEGTAAAGAAMALALSETLMSVLLVRQIGRDALDRRTVLTMVKTLAVSVAVFFLDLLLAPLGPARLLLSASAYVVLVLATGAVRVGDLRMLVNLIHHRRQLASAETSVPAAS
jgi:O-antigen/teichoic acid export membrane protein